MAAIPHDQEVTYTWPSVCRKCGSIEPTFQAKLFLGTTFEVNVPTLGTSSKPCNSCGGERLMLPGRFRIKDGVVTASGSFSAEAVATISRLLQRMAAYERPLSLRRSTLQSLVGRHPELAAILELLGEADAEGQWRIPKFLLAAIFAAILETGCEKLLDQMAAQYFPPEPSTQERRIDDFLEQFEELREQEKQQRNPDVGDPQPMLALMTPNPPQA